MSEKLEMTGIIHVILPEVVVTDKFKKREFVVQIPNAEYPQLILFQTTNARCDLLSPFKIGEKVKVHFNLRGRDWTKDGNTKYFNTLEAWRIETQEPEQPVSYYNKPVEPEPVIDFDSVSSDNDLPF